MASGPLPRETLDRIMALDALAIRGNADRELLERGGRGLSDDWVASQLQPRHDEWLRSLPETIELAVEQVGSVVFCHGSPRSDEEMMLRTTPDERLREFVDGVEAEVVVCGHTHMQFDRTVGSRRVVNAGSVGLPYGAPGAHWLLLGPGVELRQTPYDVDAAAERLLAGGWPQAPKLVEENVRRVPSEEEALGFFEQLAREHGWF
jgi:diadenosine tetraphosphatase ApaH/serine/threonine PP2A family protein phosphatase